MKRKLSKLAPYIIVVAFIVSSCSFPVTRRPFTTGYVEKGIASWYGKDFHGRPTSSGEIFNMYDLTAAHRLIPLGTIVKVTNLKNDRSVVVKINDRGPFVDGRIIDLSYYAARKLGMAEEGLAPVEIRVLKWGSKAGDFTVQVGSFTVKNNAQRLMKHLKKKYPDTYIVTYITNNKKFYRVRIGFKKDIKEAELLVQKLSSEGFSPFITRKD